MADYGIKVSPAGVDVGTASGTALKLLSTKDSLKLYRWGTIDGTAVGGDSSATVTFDHNLGYAPAILVYGINSGTYTPIGGGIDSYEGLLAYSDSSKLYIEGYDADSKLSAIPDCKYYILVDKAQDYSGTTNIAATGDYGIKISNLGKDIGTAKEYDLALSSKFKSLQYFPESLAKATVTLPAMWASLDDQTVEEYTYVDFNHGFGYPPLFFAWYNNGTVNREVPYAEFDTITTEVYGQSYYTDTQLYAQCDSTKIRFWFKRTAKFDYWSLYYDDTISYGSFSASTVVLNVLPLAEDLTGLNYGE
jgi:hypothetical protein